MERKRGREREREGERESKGERSAGLLVPTIGQPVSSTYFDNSSWNYWTSADVGPISILSPY